VSLHLTFVVLFVILVVLVFFCTVVVGCCCILDGLVFDSPLVGRLHYDSQLGF
jgi:hypothetical protein